MILVAAVGGMVLLGTGSAPASGSPSASPSSSAASAAAAATTESSISPTPSPTPLLARCPLNGVPIPSLPAAGQPALVVQIENHPLARPTRNLTNADIVIEGTVEGDVTRFSAVFYCQPTVGLTGPMRSARYYNVDLWQQLHALTVHFGASTGALKRFAAAGMPSINGITGAWPYFRRYGSAPAPHNLYGDIESIRADATRSSAVAALVRRAGTVRPPFAIDPGVQVPVGATVAKVTIRTNGYWTFAWTWDPGLAAWRRSDAGAADTDAATGKPLIATSVVVQRITESTVYGDPDPAGNPRRDLHLVGSGTGLLYVNGTAIAVRWSRASASALTIWTYADGTPMVLPPGPIWWEMVPVTGAVTNS